MRVLVAAVCSCLLLWQSADAQNFSVDVGQSDTFGGFPPPDDILAPGFPPGPVLVGGVAGVNVDAFSYNAGGPTPEESGFTPVYGFSVDLFAGGASGTAVATESAGAEAETDVFVSLGGGGNGLLHDGDGSTPALFPALGLAEGSGASIGGVDGYEFRSFSPLGSGVYWSVDAPSLAVSPYTTASAADVFVGGYAGGPTVFASESALGLAPGDDLDALQIYDRGAIGVFDAPDIVLFSLDGPSPTLAATGFSPGDVLISGFGGFFGVYTPGTALGLLPGDNLNALSVVPEPGSMAVLLGMGTLVLIRRRR